MVNRKRSQAAKRAAAKRKENAAKKDEVESAVEQEETAPNDEPKSKSFNWDEVYINPAEDRVFLNPVTDPSVLSKFEQLEIDIQQKLETKARKKVIAKTPEKTSSNLSIANSETLYTPLTYETPAKLVTNCKGELPEDIKIRLNEDEAECELKELTTKCDEDPKISPTTFQFSQPQEPKAHPKSAKKVPASGKANDIPETPKLEVTQCELTALFSSQAEASLINQLVNTTHGEIMKDILENPSAITATPVINDVLAVETDASHPTNFSLNESLMLFEQYEQMCQQGSSPLAVPSTLISSPSKVAVAPNKNGSLDDSSNHHLAAIPEEESFALPVDDSVAKTPGKENSSRFTLPSSVSVRQKKCPGNLLTPKEARSPFSPCNLNTPRVKIGDQTMEMLMKTNSRMAQFTTPRAPIAQHLADSSSPLTLETPARLIDVTCFNPSALRQSLLFTEDDVNELTFFGSVRKAPPKRVTRSSINSRRSSLQLMNVDLLEFSTSNPDTDI